MKLNQKSNWICVRFYLEISSKIVCARCLLSSDCVCVLWIGVVVDRNWKIYDAKDNIEKTIINRQHDNL